MPVHGSSVGIGGLSDPWDDYDRQLEARSGGLSLDEAQDIAAQRLRELAIRLGDDDTDDIDQESDDAPFDADRHFRSRLAERIAGLDDERRLRALSRANGQSPNYSITEALPLSAFDGRLQLLARRPAARPKPVVDEPEQIGFLDVLDGTIAGDEHDAAAGISEPRTCPDEIGRGLGLAELIQEQRTLLNRLADISQSYGVGGSLQVEGPAVQTSIAEQVDDLVTDADYLFDGGTYAAEPLSNDFDTLEDEVDDEDAPTPISAEELIAALKGPPLAPQSIADGKAAAQEFAALGGADRPPIIIERARAELTALANGEIPQPGARHSGAVGFLAGLSLSVVIGIGLYFAL